MNSTQRNSGFREEEQEDEEEMQTLILHCGIISCRNSNCTDGDI